MKAAKEYAELVAAMDETPPACIGLDLFTADDLAPADQGTLRRICAVCPLIVLCHAYAIAARPDAGFWAGHHYTPTASRKAQQ